MSKQPIDQEGANKTPADAQQNRPSSETPSASAAPETASSTPADDKSAADYATKNSRSRRRNKGSNNSQRSNDNQNSNNGQNSSSTQSPNNEQATPGAQSSNATASDAPRNTSNSTPNASNSTPGKSPAASTNDSATGARTSSGKPGTSNTTPLPTTPPSTGSGGGGSKVSAIAIVLVLILALVLGVVAWQLWQRLDSQQARIDELVQQTESSATQQSLSDLESRLESGEAERSETLENTVSELRSELESVQASVDETVSEVLDQLSQAQDSDERDWLHAEAAYLLRLANQRLQLEGDVDGAAALLRTADARLVDADNPALTPVRREIASELAELDAVPRVDRTGIYLALNAQQERVAGLRLSQEIEERAVNSGMEQPPQGSFERQLARFGAELRDLVVIRHHDEALEALITPEQESYLRQSLRLILEQAQLALLREEQPLFEASLDKALNLLDSYYDTERDETQSVIERLQEIRQNEVEPELPDISGSQQAMSRFIDNRFQSRRQGGGDE